MPFKSTTKPTRNFEWLLESKKIAKWVTSNIFVSLQNPSQSVAVKVVTKKGIQKASEILVKEIKILRELTALHHTNLVAMHDCMDSPAYVYVVMEVSSYFDFINIT